MEQNPNDSLFELQLDHVAGNHFNESSKWAKFLAVVYFSMIGLFVVALAFGATAMIQLFSQFAPGFEGAGGFIIAVIIIVVAVFFLTSFLLYRFATMTKTGIERQDQILFNKGLQALKNYFIVYGVLTLLGIVFTFFSSFSNLIR